MNRPNNAEFAQFRFVRNAEENVIPLPAQGIDEKNLLVLDCERWGLARLHIFEGAALRQDMLEAFQNELRQIADLRSDSVSRLITWGRDSEELFYADEMQDGEPLPEYLDRTGGVPFAIAGEWILQLFGFFEQVPQGLPSFERFTTLNFQAVIDRYQQVRPVFSEFYGWTKPGAQVQEHSREWYLAQIFCSLIAGVPVRTFYRESLPRNFEELSASTQEAVLLVLSETGAGGYDRFKKEMEELSLKADSVRLQVKLPRLLVREWMTTDLADSYRGEADFAFDPLTDPAFQCYAIPATIRGNASLVQVLPGPDSIQREGWLNQHHDATRRPGRPMLHQLHVNYIEDRNALTLVCEERVEGVDLATLLLHHGAMDLAETKRILYRVSASLSSLEQNTGSCAVWWLPPENILFLSGTSSITGSLHLHERKGSSVWDEWGVKLRLHQTATTLRDGVNLPSPVRDLSRLPGKQNELARRSAVALPLIFFLLTSHRFRWRRPVSAQADLPEPLEDLLEGYRTRLLETPESVETSLFDEFLNRDFEVPEETGESQSGDDSGSGREDGFEEMLDRTLHRETVTLTEPTEITAPDDEAIPQLENLEEPEWDESEYEIEEEVTPRRFVRGWWLVLWSVLAALFVGYLVAGWSSRLGNYEEPEEVRFPLTEYEVPPPPGPEEVIEELESYLLAQTQLDLLPHASSLEIAESRELIAAFLASRIEKNDGVAARLDALLAGLEGAPTGEILPRFFEAARLGDSAAQFDLAILVLVKGLGNMDPSVAREMLRRASIAGNPDAQELQAILLVETAPEESRILLEAAAMQNHLGALYHYGLFAANGTGGPLDPVLAAEQFERAAMQGSERAMFAIGRCYETGFGKQPDFTEATRWIKMAASLGNPAALAWCQAREIEVPAGELPADGSEAG
ncbi:MAG: tetratricopeptide repeat protein [Verrucomicrobiota bacterium]